ncbi:uncharacterized protein LOC132725097 [Ruditapes philippinarum]|uniref:uncharacterized protein LOC132725097 n=1 Tax=Ruditapes philippinarum TaxID=129788 RepID=UPI00295ADA05|nr:uncharacterized protein LOC132725097 [Ruditapes philippinarum]
MQQGFKSERKLVNHALTGEKNVADLWEIVAIGTFCYEQSLQVTCSTAYTTSPEQLWWRVELTYELYIIGLVLIIPDSGTEKYRGFTIEIGNGTGVKDLCYQHGTDSNGSIKMNIYCEKEIIGNVVEIKLAKNVDKLTLCEVRIFGGRHLSFNKYTLQKETTFWNGFWNSSYA